MILKRSLDVEQVQKSGPFYDGRTHFSVAVDLAKEIY